MDLSSEDSCGTRTAKNTTTDPLQYNINQIPPKITTIDENSLSDTKRSAIADNNVHTNNGTHQVIFKLKLKTWI